MHDFRKLNILKKLRVFVKDIYLITKKIPNEEKFGLTQQILHASASMISNITEGSERNTEADFAHFLDMANGSAFEVETQLYNSLDLEYISQKVFDNIISDLLDIEKMIFNLRKSLTK